MNKKLKTTKGTLCSLASVLSSGVLMASNVSAATINYYSGTTTNNGDGTQIIEKTLGNSLGRDNKYRGLYSSTGINGVLDSTSADGADVAVFENIIKEGFVFNNWKVSSRYGNSGRWSNVGIKSPGTSMSRTDYNLNAVAQWTDLKKAVFANGSTERMVVGTPFEVKNDEEVKIGEISLDYKINTTRDADGATEETPLSVTSVDEKLIFTPDEANGYELKKVEVKIGEAEEATDMTDDVEKNVLTLSDVKENVAIDAKIGLKEFNVTASVTNTDGASVSPIPAVEYGSSATFDVTVNEGYKISKILKGEEETELTVENEQLVIENVTADAAYTIVVEPEVYEIIEGDGQDVNVSEVDKALFRFDGPFELFLGVDVDGEIFPNTKYEAYEGSTYIAIEKNELIALGSGEHILTAFYGNGTSAETSFTVSGIPTTPDTGANSKLGASTVVSILAYAATGSALALALLAIKRKMNR